VSEQQTQIPWGDQVGFLPLPSKAFEDSTPWGGWHVFQFLGDWSQLLRRAGHLGVSVPSSSTGPNMEGESET
jgi:hypothetical protein